MAPCECSSFEGCRFNTELLAALVTGSEFSVVPLQHWFSIKMTTKCFLVHKRLIFKLPLQFRNRDILNTFFLNMNMTHAQ